MDREALVEQMEVNLKRLSGVGGELGPDSLRRLVSVIEAIREEAEREYEEEKRARPEAGGS